MDLEQRARVVMAAVKRSLATRRFNGRANLGDERRWLLDLARAVAAEERRLRPLCSTARARRGRDTKQLCASHARLLTLLDRIAHLLDLVR